MRAVIVKSLMLCANSGAWANVGVDLGAVGTSNAHLRKLSADYNASTQNVTLAAIGTHPPPKNAGNKPPPAGDRGAGTSGGAGGGGRVTGDHGGGGGDSRGGGGGGSGGDGSTNVASSSHHSAATGLVGLAAAAAIVGAGIATASLRGRKVDVAHPLKGSITRRIELFSHLAEHRDVERPPRRYDGDVYLKAPDAEIGAEV